MKIKDLEPLKRLHLRMKYVSWSEETLNPNNKNHLVKIIGSKPKCVIPP